MRVSAASIVLLAATLGPAAEIAAASPPPRVFLETEVNPSNPYVQAAARVTVRIYSARALYHADLDLPATADMLVRESGADERGTARRGGLSYDVLTRHYVVFPQRSGKLSLPGAVLSAQVLSSTARAEGLYGPGGADASQYGYGAMMAVVPLQLHGDAVALNVRPRPAGEVSSYWMPARQVALSSEWSPGSPQAHVGDALTLDLTVQAEGLTAEQLPDLSTLLVVPPGLKAYPDEPRLDNSTPGDTLIGRREQSIALIADRPGTFTLPALELRWWDTTRDVAQEVVVPARTIVMLPSQAAPAVLAHPAARAEGATVRASPGDPWLWASVALALAWMATLGGWYGARRSPRRSPPREPAPAPPPGAAHARAAFLQACRTDDPRAARRHLLAWVDAERPASPPAGLNGMARQIGDREIERLLRELDRACYAGGPWSGEALARALSELPAAASPDAERKPRLAPLYH